MRISSLCQIISTSLGALRTSCFCQQCIALQIAVQEPKAISRAMISLSSGPSPDFSRYRASCERCGKFKMTIRKNRLAWA